MVERKEKVFIHARMVTDIDEGEYQNDKKKGIGLFKSFNGDIYEESLEMIKKKEKDVINILKEEQSKYYSKLSINKILFQNLQLIEFKIIRNPPCIVVGAMENLHKTRLGSVWIYDSKSQTQPRKEYSLIRLKYPGILQVLEPLIEEKSYIAFVTEKIDHTLSQAMSDSKFQLSDIEMKLHLLEVIDGIQFLHNNGQVHLDLCPDKVFITEGGKWKIGRLADCTQIDLNERNSVIKLNNRRFNEFQPYMAPEQPQTTQQFQTHVWPKMRTIIRGKESAL